MRYPLIDLLRYFSAMLVALHHYRLEIIGDKIFAYLGSIPIVGFLVKNGTFGVEIFFVISGFVIIESARNKSATNFLSLRFIRLFPGLLISMIIVVILGELVVNPYEAPIKSFINTIFLSYNLTNTKPLVIVVWTLIYEIRFYLGITLLILVCPLIFKNDKYLMLVLCIWQLPLFISRNLYPSNKYSEFIDLLSLNIPGINNIGVMAGTLFSIGILLNIITDYEKKCLPKINLVKPFLLILIFSYFGIILTEYQSGVVALILLSMFVIYISPKIAFQSQILYKLGFSSYIIYLTHIHVGLTFWAFLRRFITTNQTLSLMAVLIFVTCFGLFIAFYIEKPLQKILNKFLIKRCY
jgi:peptidoglycan/LPS O-acetylase OafA/YrhL